MGKVNRLATILLDILTNNDIIYDIYMKYPDKTTRDITIQKAARKAIKLYKYIIQNILFFTDK